MQDVVVLEHPLVVDSLAHLRNKHTPIEKFRFHSDKICTMIFSEVIRGLPMRDEEIETPVGPASVKKLSSELVIIPVLRSGVAMVFGALHTLPKAKVGFVGFERDENTAVATQYYWKVPPMNPGAIAIIADPMLATGGTILNVLRKLPPEHISTAKIACVIASQEGIDAVHAEFPSVPIVTGGLDPELNSKKYIVPGLGDYGDRYFGTEQ